MIELSFPWWVIPLGGLLLFIGGSVLYLWWCARGGGGIAP
jgi:hypothetical protein